MERLNCWEFIKCGREPGGEQVEKCGLCPAAVDNPYNTMNNGKHAGRFCWVIAGTYCMGKVEGTYAAKLRGCLKCDFMNRVHAEEGSDFILTKEQAKEVYEIDD